MKKEIKDKIKNKVLIVAHPDDEILWFNIEKYTKIIIVFMVLGDGREWLTEARKKAVSEHPLKDRLECWGLRESNYWRDPSKLDDHLNNYKIICEKLKDVEADEIDTHNSMGEYQHADHILVHNAVLDTVNCRVNGLDPKVYRKIKDTYVRNNAWTWY